MLITSTLLGQVPVTEKNACPPGILLRLKQNLVRLFRTLEKAGTLTLLVPGWQQKRQFYPWDRSLCQSEEGETTLKKERQGAVLLGSDRLSVVIEGLAFLFRVWSVASA